jgi:hypothetical protein
MITERQRNAVKSLLKSTPFEKGEAWLRRIQIQDSQGIGWPHLTALNIPTVWGGTLDGIRGLLACGVSKYDPVVADSLNWLLSQRNLDHGYGSREITYSGVEPTAWVLIAVKELGFNIPDRTHFVETSAFLESCIRDSGEVATSNDPNEEARTYPSVLTLWALNGESQKTYQIARFLKDARDPISGGWGIKPKAVPNVASTAQVLYILLATNNLSKDDVITRQAIEYLLNNQKADGSWENFTETWYSIKQPHVPLRCEEYSTTWVLQALLEAGLSPAREPVVKAISWLIYEQAEDGYWLYNRLDDSKHIWCTADAVVALTMARKSIIDTVADKEYRDMWSEGDARDQNYILIPKNFISQFFQYLRKNITTILVIMLSIYVFNSQIQSFIVGVQTFFQVQGDSIISDLLASVIYAFLFFLGAALLTRIRGVEK